MFAEIKKIILLSFLELKLKNKNTYLGFFWYFLQPLLMFFILFYLKKYIFNIDIKDFVMYLIIGILIINFFVNSTNGMMNTFINNKHFLNSRKINPMLFLRVRFLSHLWIHLFEFLIAFIILFFLGYYYSFLYILIIPIISPFIFGIGVILAIINSKLFDINYIWNYLSQIIWFITPVYFIAIKDLFFIKLNPFTYFLDLARSFTNNFLNFNLEYFLICIILSSTFLLIGKFVFENYKFNLIEDLK